MTWMIMQYVNKKLTQFKTWWSSRATLADRLWAFVSGAWAGLWLGAIGHIVVSDLPMSMTALFWFAVSAALVLGVAGLIFPKAVRCISFPFLFLSIFGSGV